LTTTDGKGNIMTRQNSSDSEDSKDTLDETIFRVVFEFPDRDYWSQESLNKEYLPRRLKIVRKISFNRIMFLINSLLCCLAVALLLYTSSSYRSEIPLIIGAVFVLYFLRKEAISYELTLLDLRYSNICDLAETNILIRSKEE
jgi:hypothetical protein